MNTSKSKIVFIEYSTTEKGQHFMTVILKTNRERQIVGRIYRDYNKDIGKYDYLATDWQGNTIFFDTHDLTELKKKYIEHSQSLALTIPMNPGRRMHIEKEPGSTKYNRVQGLKQDRNKKPERNIKEPINNETKKELERDKELKQIRNPEPKPEIEKDTRESSESFKEDFEQSEKSERDIELDEIRERDDEYDRGEELDR